MGVVQAQATGLIYRHYSLAREPGGTDISIRLLAYSGVSGHVFDTQVFMSK